MNAERHANLALCLRDGLGGVAQRFARRQIEGNGEHRKLSLVVDRQRRVRSLEMAEGRKRYLRSRDRFHVNPREISGIVLKLRSDLEYHVVLVELRKDGRYLALSERVVKRVINGL